MPSDLNRVVITGRPFKQNNNGTPKIVIATYDPKTYCNLIVTPTGFAPGGGDTFHPDDMRRLRDELDHLYPTPPANTVTPLKANKRKTPNGAQAYKGNGNHKWEPVTCDPKGAGHTYRIRVPGGFIYRTVSIMTHEGVEYTDAQSTVFVPMPEVVGYGV